MLVPIDGSEIAEGSLPFARELSSRLGWETTLLHVCSIGEVPSLAVCKSYVEHTAEEVNKDDGKKWPPIAADTVVGVVPDSILIYAETHGANIILLTRYGKTGKTRWFMGTVAHRLITAANVPVLIVNPDGKNSEVPAGWPNSVLVLLDQSKPSEAILPWVEDLCGQTKSRTEIVLFSVCEPPDLLSDYPEAIMPMTWEEHVKKAKAAAEEKCGVYLADLSRRLSDSGMHVNIHTVVGKNVVDEIKRYISSRPFDLVAMTTRGQSGTASWPFGHVADRIIQDTQTPLLLVRPPSPETG